MILKSITDACYQHSVVICTLALPDASWPEGLKSLSTQAKANLAKLLNSRDVHIITPEVQSLVQQRNAGEGLIASLLQFSIEDRLGAFAEPRPCEPPYLVVRPVNLHAGRDHVILRQTNTDYVSVQEMTALADSIAPLFATEGLQLLRGDDLSRWFLKPVTAEGEQFLGLKASDSQQALGRNIDAYMTSGDSARRWRRLETEIQMTWFEHPVNGALQARGHHELNSLWIEGSLRVLPTKPPWLTSVESVRPELTQLGHFWHLQSRIEGQKVGNLSVVDGWQSRLSGDAFGWLAAWENFLDPRMPQFQNLEAANAVWVMSGEENLVVAIPSKTSLQARLRRLLRTINPSQNNDIEKALMLT